MPQPVARPSLTTSATAISAYVEAVSEALGRTLVSSIETLEEPASPADPERATKLLASVIEMLAGFAIGAAIGLVASAVRRQLPAEVRTAVDRDLAEATRRCGAVPLDRGHPTLVRSFLADRDERPLLDELGTRLQLRLIHAAIDLREALSAIARAIERIAPDQLRWFTSTLTLHARDEMVTERFAHQLQCGWLAYRSVLVNGSLPEGEPWQLWSRRMRGEKPQREVLVPIGCIVQIQ
jgi:hypothetical protein